MPHEHSRLSLLTHWLNRVGQEQALSIFTVVAVVLSVGTTFMVMKIAGKDVPIFGIVVAVVVPLLLTPILGGLTLRLHFALQRAHGEVERLAVTDTLTAVYNRQYFEDIAHRDLIRAKRYDEMFCILLLDVDDLGHVNDEKGHWVGDAVLRSVAGLIDSHCRDTDLLARYAGEEFIILLPHTRDLEGAELARRIVALVARTPMAVGGASLHITLSAGVAAFVDGDEVVGDLVGRAKEALAQAQKHGKSQVMIFGKAN